MCVGSGVGRDRGRGEVGERCTDPVTMAGV